MTKISNLSIDSPAVASSKVCTLPSPSAKRPFPLQLYIGGIVARAFYVYDGRGGEACDRICVKRVGVIVFGEACGYEFA